MTAGDNDYSEFFQLSLDLLCIADTDGYFRRVNPAFSSVLGYTQKDLLSTTYYDLVHPDDLLATIDEVQNLASGQPTVHFENRFLTVDGQYRWLSWTAAPSENGLLYAIARDVTQEKEREKELTDLLENYKNAERYRQSTSAQLKLADAQIGVVLNAAADGFLLTDLDRRIIWANPALRKMFGMESMDIIGQPSTALGEVLGISVADPEGFIARVNEIYENRELVVEEEIVETLQPTAATLSRSSVPVLSVENEYLGRLWVYRDVTRSRAMERARSEAELKNKQISEINVTKSLFISTISHELRTPLTSILAFSGLLKKRVGEQMTGRDEKHLDAILRSGHRLKELINDLLDISYLESDVMRVHASTFKLEDAIGNVMDAVRPMLEQKSQHIRTVLANPESEEFNDMERFEQIVGNLVSNASKYSGHGKEITIRATSTAESLSVSVTDQGDGIDKDQLQTVFEAFSRLDNEQTRSNDGPGLGLAISRKLARAMGGDVNITSTGEEGSVFTVVLPRELPEAKIA